MAAPTVKLTPRNEIGSYASVVRPIQHARQRETSDTEKATAPALTLYGVPGESEIVRK